MSDLAFERVLVTGSTGFLGRHLMPVLYRRYGTRCVAGSSSREYDLTDPVQVRRMFEKHRPDVLIHLAAYVGGIGANRDYPATFFYRNILLTALVFEAAAEYRIRRLLYPMGGCSYPARAASPIDEGQMWEGFPQPESAAYSVAKKTGLVAAEAYRREKGLSSVVVIPGNMYGEYDNFRVNESHVVPALVRRFWEARLAGSETVTAWGTGQPVRDFVYAGDVAATFPYLLEHYDRTEPINLSSGTATSIRELTETVKELTGYEGRIVWDASLPDGQMEKVFDVSRMRSLGLACATPLREGLMRTVEWFGRCYARRDDGIRL